MTRELPIIMNTEQVKATLDGRKTQIRRPLKPQPPKMPDGAYCDPYNKNYNHFTFWSKDHRMYLHKGNIKNTAHWKPQYQIGDKLYVREAYLPLNKDEEHMYEADYRNLHKLEQVKWKSPVSMPKKYARIWLEVTNIRVEKIQDISESDARAEGFMSSGWSPSYNDPDNSNYEQNICACEYFYHYWNSIYPGSWDRNDWVFVCEFKVVKVVKCVI